MSDVLTVGFLVGLRNVCASSYSHEADELGERNKPVFAVYCNWCRCGVLIYKLVLIIKFEDSSLCSACVNA